MKKLLSLILALCLVLSLAACGTDPEPTTVPTTQPTTAPSAVPTTVPTEPSIPETTEPPVMEGVHDIPMTAISITEETEVTKGNDGNAVFEYTYQNIRLVLPDPEMAMTVNLDILNRIDATRADADSILADALNMGVGAVPFSYHVRYSPARIDSGILSLSCVTIRYTGGAHGGSSCSGLTYDLTTGKILTLADVLVSGITADAVCPLVIDALASLPEEYYLFSDYSVTVEDRFSGDFLADESWYLSDAGLCFTFAPYEIAPNSTGVVHAVIPYEQLTGILNDAWFPPERVTPNGALEVLPFSQADAEEFDQLAELYLDRVGGTYLLHATDLIYDVVIESGFWNLDGTVFTPNETVFRADSLVAADAVLVQADIPDVLPNLRITYTAEEGNITVFLSASGEDGTPLLLTY